MAKENKPEKRRRRSGNTVGQSALQTMQGLALAVSIGGLGVAVLNRMPHGFESLEEGLGKKPTSNKRVLIVAALLLWCILHKSIKIRLWSIPLTALLTVAVIQHRATYLLEEPSTQDIVEKY